MHKENSLTSEPTDPKEAAITEVIRAELERTRQDFHALVESIPKHKWRSPTAHPSWSVADVLFHMTLALRFLPGDVSLIRRVNWVPQFPGFIFHRVNDWYTRWGGRRGTPRSVRQAYDAAHATTLQALASVHESEWAVGAHYPGWDPMLEGLVTLEDLFHYPAKHFRAHALQIQSAMEDEDIPRLDENA